MVVSLSFTTQSAGSALARSMLPGAAAGGFAQAEMLRQRAAKATGNRNFMTSLLLRRTGVPAIQICFGMQRRQRKS
jgi:phosphoribosylformylglycinamidine (FGAM) synthase-like amidotransferase family enzyme